MINFREETDWSEEQARQVELRIQGVLDQLPEAVRHAHVHALCEAR